MCLGEQLAECRVVELAEGHVVGLITCEGDGDVVGVVTPLVRGGAQVLHGDQVVEVGEGQVEVEDGRGELKEKRTCTWMTRDETQT